MRNTTTPVAFPASFTEFEKGKVYVFTYNGTSLALTRTWPIPSPGWPKAPENFQAEVISTSSVRLSWDVIHNAESYRVYRAVGSETGKYSQIADADTPSYTDNSIKSNESYYYTVCAIKNSKEGKRSIAITPVNFRVIGSGDNFVFFAWDNVSGASSYNIYRSKTKDGNYIKVSTSTVRSDYSYSWAWDTSLEPNTTYYYKVSVVINGTEVMQFGAISATTISPIDFRVTNTTATSISLAWNAVSGAEYNIYRSTSNIGTSTRITNNFLTANSYTDTGLSPNSTYYYELIVWLDRVVGFSRRISATTNGE